MTKCLIPLLAIIFSCVSVPVIANPTCAIKLNNDLHQHLMFDHTNGQDVNLTIINQSFCEVMALAVGGGGQLEMPFIYIVVTFQTKAMKKPY